MGWIATKTRPLAKGRTVNDEEGLLYKPTDYRPNNTRRGIIFLHGKDGGYKQGGSGSDASAYENVIIPILSKLRLPVLSINGGSNAGGVIEAGGTARQNVTGAPDHWGNPISCRALTNWITHATLTPPVSPSDLHIYPGFKATGGVILIGFSMGGVQAHNFAARNPSLVKALVTIAPPMNLHDIYTNNRNSYAALMDAAYNGPNPNAPTKVSGGTGTNYLYRVVPILSHDGGTTRMDGSGSPASATLSFGLRATLGTTPSVIAWTFTAGVFNTSLDVIGYKITRNVAGGGYEHAPAMVQGAGIVSQLIPVNAALTSIPVEALAPLYAGHTGVHIQPSTTMVLVDHDWTSLGTVTVTAAGANVGATAVPIASFNLTRPVPAGARLLPTRFSDAQTSTPPAYTFITSPWTTHGKNATPSNDPVSYFGASDAIKAIQHQMWYTSADTIVEASAQASGVIGPNLSAYKTAYGANLDDEALAGDPTHGQAFTGFTQAKRDILLDFIDNHL